MPKENGPFLAASMLTGAGYAECLTMAQCKALQACGGSGGTGYCCPAGTETVYSCPSGWTLNGTTCRRANGTASDTKGYYLATYGSCAATGEEVKCFEHTTSSTTSSGVACFSCVSAS